MLSKRFQGGWRPWAMLLTLGAFFASASGLGLVLHLHEGDSDHHACDVCYKLTVGSTALLSQATLIAPITPYAYPGIISQPACPPDLARHTPAAPRAPPLA